jgi:hypothetical protein
VLSKSLHVPSGQVFFSLSPDLSRAMQGPTAEELAERDRMRTLMNQPGSVITRFNPQTGEQTVTYEEPIAHSPRQEVEARMRAAGQLIFTSLGGTLVDPVGADPKSVLVDLGDGAPTTLAVALALGEVVRTAGGGFARAGQSNPLKGDCGLRSFGVMQGPMSFMWLTVAMRSTSGIGSTNATLRWLKRTGNKH